MWFIDDTNDYFILTAQKFPRNWEEPSLVSLFHALSSSTCVWPKQTVFFITHNGKIFGSRPGI